MGTIVRLYRNASTVPLQGRYPSAVALALLALCPFIVLTTASLLFEKQLVHDLGTTSFGIQLSAGLSNAGYAFGAVAAADIGLRISQRRVYMVCEAAFAVGSLLAAFAPGITAFVVGRTLQGLATGMLLVVALPPLVTNHGVQKLPLTAAFVNLGLFGMVTLGPTVGGLAAGFSAWRALYVGVAALGVLGLAVGYLAFDPSEAASPGMGFDWSGVPIAAAATVLPFLGAAWLSRGGFSSPGFLIPLIAGLAALGTLVVRQYRKPQALMPMKLLAHTLPVTGIAGAMLSGAGFTTLIELTAVYLLRVVHLPAVTAGALLATQLVGIVIAAWLFKVVLPSRWMPALAFVGVGVVAAGGAVLIALGPGVSFPVVAVAGLLLGFGAGAGVAPGLFMGGLSVPSSQLGPVFALVELLRAEAAFLIGPILLAIAMQVGSLAGGLRLAIVVITVFTAIVGAGITALLLLGGKRPHAPDLSAWLDGEASAFDSPPVAAVLRR
jgi:MFS family permease